MLNTNAYFLILFLSAECCFCKLSFRFQGGHNVCPGSTSHNYSKRVYKEEKLAKFWQGNNAFASWKSFPVDIFADVANISAICQKEYNEHVEGLHRNNLNSLKMFDASAKLPSGLLSGNVNQYGDFDECLQVPNAKYCLALIDLQSIWNKHVLGRYKDKFHSHFSIQETFNDPTHRVPGFTFVRWGFCLPKNCQENDLIRALAYKLGAEAEIKPRMCQSGNPPPFRASYGHYFAWGYFVFILTSVGISSLLFKWKRKYPEDNIWMNLLLAFAIQRNYKQLTKLSENRDEFRSVHGVRFLSALSLLMAHKTMASLYNPYMNKFAMAEIQAMGWSVIGRNAIVYTDCFLLISGLLNANALFTEYEINKRLRFRAKLLNRFTRIFPGMVTVILFCTYILPYLGSGPMWPTVIDHHAELCKRHMWKNVFFLHNYFGFENMCLTHTHQLAIDMQLFLVTPLFVLALIKNTFMGLFIVGFAMFLSAILRFYNTMIYNLNLVVHFGIPISRMFDTANYSYILPTHRATIYLIGVLLARLLRCPIKLALTKRRFLLFWSLIYVVGFTTWFSPIFMSVKGYEYNNTGAAIYGAVYPFTWGAAIASAIYASENEFGGWLSDILTWKYFGLFTKIAYGVYLVQFPVFFYNVGVTRHVDEYKSHKIMLPPVETAIIISLSILFTLFVEMPFNNVHKLVTNKLKNKLC